MYDKFPLLIVPCSKHCVCPGLKTHTRYYYFDQSVKFFRQLFGEPRM